MNTKFISWREKNNVIPIEFKSKEKYMIDLLNIEHSFTGRTDARVANTFIMESVQLIVNAIVLFEKGYFDSAYYSLRQAVEVSTTMVYLSDIQESIRAEKLIAWKTTREFPMQNQMLKYLKENGHLFKDMKNKLALYFEELSEVSKKLNKFVHKQGFKYFYVSRNNFINKAVSEYDYLGEFEYYLKRIIGIVAMMRLAIDPFPILLMDGEIYNRTFDTLTEAYDEEFVSEYIGIKTVEEYKKTDIYIEHYKQIMTEERKLPCVVDVIKHNYIDRKQIRDILSQLYLLNNMDSGAILLVNQCEKAAMVYCCGGIQMYFTDKKTNRSESKWSTADFNHFSELEIKANIPYDEAFITVVPYNGDDFYIEHNDILNEEEINKLFEL